jgi:hypothetical protein
MSVECPAADCGYTGHLDAVEGHIGGVSEGHDGLVPADLRKSLHGEGSEGLAVGLIALVVVVAVLWYLHRQGDGEESETADTEASEGLEAGGEW